MAETDNYISHELLIKVEDIAKVQAYVNARPEVEPFWASFAEKATWEKGHSTLTYRQLDLNDYKVSDVETYKMTEAVAPAVSKIVYKAYTCKTRDFGSSYPYTDVALRHNYDDVVKDIMRALKFQVSSVKETLIGSEFTKSRYTLTLGTGATKVIDLFKTAKNVLIRNHAQGRRVAILTPEYIGELETELTAQGVALPESIKGDMNIDGAVKRFMGFDIYERADTFMDDGANAYAIFFAETSVLGLKPVKTFNGEKVDIFDNKLGSGVIKDASGNIVADANHQVGSVAWSLTDFAAIHQADEIHLVCKMASSIDAATLDGTLVYNDGATAGETATAPKGE